jgi:hypothetical protein
MGVGSEKMTKKSKKSEKKVKKSKKSQKKMQKDVQNCTPDTNASLNVKIGNFERGKISFSK